MHQFDKRPADEVPLLPAQQVRPCRVDGHDRGVEAGDEHEVAGQAPDPVAIFRPALDLTLQFLAGTGQDLARFDLIVDVRACAEPTGDSASFVPDAFRPAEDPSVLAGNMAQPMFDAVGLASLERAAPDRHDPLPILMMDQVLPELIIGRARRDTREIVPALVEVIVETVGRVDQIMWSTKSAMAWNLASLSRSRCSARARSTASQVRAPTSSIRVISEGVQR